MRHIQTADWQIIYRVTYTNIYYIYLYLYLYEALVWLTEVLVWLTQARVYKSAVCICRTPINFTDLTVKMETLCSTQVTVGALCPSLLLHLHPPENNLLHVQTPHPFEQGKYPVFCGCLNIT